MQMRNLVKEKIAKQGYALGAFVASSSPMNCEILAMNGIDFMIIDCEHAQTDAEAAVNMFRACELYGAAPIVRVYNPYDGPMMSRYLDIGAHGVMTPLVSTVEQARNIVDNMKYAPLGKRGANGGRGPRWGAYDDYIHVANDNTLAIAQIESLEGLSNVEEIAAMPGIDGLFIGTGDLSLEMGLQFKADSAANHKVESEEMVKNIDRILKAALDNGKIPGIVTASAEDAIRRINQGFQLVTCMNDLGFFRSRSKSHLESIREAVYK